jgi:nucleoside-diphosphate-sugar epimerase
MKLFVAGGTGVLGSRAVPRLIEAGHDVTALSRSPAKSAALESVGAHPLTVDLFDQAAVAAAVVGHDVVINLATHIPDISKAARSSAWEENDRIRTEGSRILVDAAIAANARRYIQESISFFYVDGGADWVDEDAPMQVPGFAAAFHAAEAQAERFTKQGGVGVALRFAMFYGDGASHTTFQLKAARRGLSPFPGPPDGYQTFLHLDDAASAVVAALDAPAGIYNIAEDEPGTRQELAAALGAALGRRPGWAVPGLVKLGGKKMEYMARSMRVSNRRFRTVTGWAPSYPTPAAGWAQVVAAGDAGSGSSDA